MMLEAGELTVDLRNGVALRSSRPMNLGRAFIGKTPQQALGVVSLLFAVCRRAQAEACRRALAAAGAVSLKPPAGADVVAEALREHLMRIAVDWAKALAETPDPMQLRRIHGLVAEAVRDPGAALATAQAQQASLIGEAWPATAQTVAGRLIRLVRDKGWERAGAVAALHPAETTAFTLMAQDARVQAAGNGLRGRLTARIAHVEHLIRQLQDGEPAEAAQGIVTSRGLLQHRARLEGGLIAAYEVIAPTDVNFTADGPLALSLLTRPSWDEGAARLLIEAFDPCIAYRLRVS